ncbi:phosphopantetheine adenylyltransferase [Nitzschia inconspicua]|uniref:Phosphopantetheine adenylyltransferase n=1 Tax=Nitzschia inconspicua TaxID=303405 RepID=A0A9K3L3L1_9STRA|nr:phosphopantetheine adenylyltransferase [Nitzschia inconspicua]
MQGSSKQQSHNRSQISEETLPSYDASIRMRPNRQSMRRIQKTPPLVSLIAIVLVCFGDRIHGFLTSSSRALIQLSSWRKDEVSPFCVFSHKDDFQHTLAILSMPTTSTDKIANEAILDKAVKHTRKLSVVLRCQGDTSPSLARLRRYVGEVYSTLWDVAMASGDPDFCDVVVYPQNLPNAAPEAWIHCAPDLDSVCSHDSICGWVSESAMGRGLQFQKREGDGMGGLDNHVSAMNAEREYRDLPPVVAVHVDPWPKGASAEWQSHHQVMWLDDEEEGEDIKKRAIDKKGMNGDVNGDVDGDDGVAAALIGGARIPTECLFEKVAVGGTFDGMHYGHRKLLTLAVSSVNPRSGKLMVGVTVDDMLRHKSFNEEIPLIKERIDGVRDFLYRLAPGIKNRIKLRAIDDAYGPPGTVDEGRDFDALVLSHETLDNGHKLNEYRQNELGLEPLALLCTRRTEPYGMSSTALRRRKWEKKNRRTSSPVV